jgi:hypothetical protein
LDRSDSIEAIAALCSSRDLSFSSSFDSSSEKDASFDAWASSYSLRASSFARRTSSRSTTDRSRSESAA